MSHLLDSHLKAVKYAMTNGHLVVFLGAGANLCGRPPEMKWQPNNQYLPSGNELADYLAQAIDYPSTDNCDLLRVSQYIDIKQGVGPLYEKLRHIFNADYDITPLHSFLARLPGLLRERGDPCNLLIVTTNYDDLLEQAFMEAKEPFDLVTYVAEAPEVAALERGKCLHWKKPNSKKPELILEPNKYRGVTLKQQSAILKIHGAVNRNDENRDSYVITENHYIDYLTHTDLSLIVPANLVAKLQKSSILFLGYSLRDWNLRAILRRTWNERIFSYNSWAIQLDPDELEEKFWSRHNIEIINCDLAEYIALIDQYLQADRPAGVQ
jgi:hypothetical protein